MRRSRGYRFQEALGIEDPVMSTTDAKSTPDAENRVGDESF